MLHALVFPVVAGILGWAQAELPDPPATWILQIEGDAAGLEVTGATRRPFAWRAPRGLASIYRITLVSADGTVVGTVPLDLSDFCLKAPHRGRPAHVFGDRTIAHDVCLTAKVPARDDVAELRIVQLRAGQARAVLGRIDRASLLRVADRKSDAERGTEPPQQTGESTPPIGTTKSTEKLAKEAVPPKPVPPEGTPSKRYRPYDDGVGTSRTCSTRLPS